jgi:hypothetical protein
MYQFWSESTGLDRTAVRYFVIPSFDDVYVVGDDGSIWSRYQKIGINWIISDNWTRLNPGRNPGGYLYVILRFRGKSYTKYIHQLVCEAVYDSCPTGLEVCHNDSNQVNNHWLNLRYDTRSNNHVDKIIRGTSGKGERNSQAKLKLGEVREIRAKHAIGGYTQEDLALEYGVSEICIWKIVNNKTWVEDSSNQ